MTIKKKAGAKGTRDKSERYIKEAKYCLKQDQSIKVLKSIGFSLLVIAVELRDLRKEITKARKEEKVKRVKFTLK